VADPVLYDAVTLRHFAAISRLELLQACHGNRDEPRWSAAVKLEVETSAALGHVECRSIIEMDWLGVAIEPTPADVRPIMFLRIALGNAGYETEDPQNENKHAGEAESIQLAKRLNLCFVTDDNDAYRVAIGRLGAGRVFDTVDLLRLAVANDDLRAADAVEVTNRIRAADRFLRREYERLLTPGDFQ
jgi:predicted nucleic acid-binding protein